MRDPALIFVTPFDEARNAAHEKQRDELLNLQSKVAESAETVGPVTEGQLSIEGR